MDKTRKQKSINQILTLMLAFVMVFTGMGMGSWGVDEAWADGIEQGNTSTSAVWDGTTKTEPQKDTSGVYQIGTGAELAWFAHEVNVSKQPSIKAALTANIDLGGHKWTPIGINAGQKYNGTFDGNGHAIKNMGNPDLTQYPTDSNNAYSVGLFASLDKFAVIRNLNVEGEISFSDLEGLSGKTKSLNCGGIAGSALSGGQLIHCTSSVDITINGDAKGFLRIGGIIGNIMKNAKIIGCQSYGNINCKINKFEKNTQFIYVGGLAGNAADTCFDGAYNAGDISASISGSGKAVVCGGIVGTLTGASQLNNTHNTGTITASSTITGSRSTAGGLAGSFDGKSGYPTNATYQQDGEMVGVYDKNGNAVTDETSGVSAKTAEELKADAFLEFCNSVKAITNYQITWEKGENGYPKIASAVRVNTAPKFLTGVEPQVETSIEPGETYTINLRSIFYDAESDPITYTVAINDADPVAVSGSYTFTGSDTGVTTLIFYASDGQLQSEPYTVIIDVRAPAFTGTGTEDDPYIISNTDALKDFSEKYNKKTDKYKDKFWKQTAEIDMEGVAFSPIGEKTAFSGHYDGGRYAIKNLSINSAAENVGLFGQVSGESTLENIHLAESCTISGNAEGLSIGAVAGTVSGGKVTIKNCENHAAVISSAPGGFNTAASYAGGIVGTLGSGNKVLNSKNFGNISQTVAHTWYAGGIAGSQGRGAIIAGCANHGNVEAASSTAYSTPGTGSKAGGITAYSYGGYISGCYNDGNVSAGQYAGGIVGRAEAGSESEGVIESCYNLGKVIGNAGDANAQLGGIAGNIGYTILNNCYDAGTRIANSGATNTKKGAIMGGGFFGSEMKGNYFLGTALSEAYGSVGNEDTPSEANFKPMKAGDMKDAAFAAQLNTYTEPYSLYQASWDADTDNSNQGYPRFSKVEKIPSHYAELKSFTVTIDGATYTGIISGKNISIVLPAGTTEITPTIEISEQAKVAPASEESVTLQDGKATFTVTAENGKEAVYTLFANIPSEAGGLAALKLTSYPDDILAAGDFSQGTKKYTLNVGDEKIVGRTLIFSAIPATGGATMTAKLNDAAEIALTAASSLSERSGSTKLWDSTAVTQPIHAGKNTLTITVTQTSGEAVIYTFYINVTPTLSALTVKNGEDVLAFDKAFSGNVTDYTLSVPDTVTSLNLSAAARMGDFAQITLPSGTDSNGRLDITNLTSFEIQVGDENAKTTYKVTLDKKATYRARIAVTPEDSIVVVCDADGKTMQPNEDGTYTLVKEETYTVRATKAGYGTIEQSLTEGALKDGILSLTLKKTGTSLPSFTGDWTSFRGNDSNNGVTTAQTPKTADTTKELWAVKCGSGYTNAPTPQLLVNGHLYVQSGSTLYILDPKTGGTLKSGKTAGSSTYATNPVTYGDGMIFVSIDDGNDSYIQALNAETLESLWVSEKVSGQLISPVTYHNGYLYTGTWNSERKIGTYYMLSATDEDTTKTNETKKILWKLEHEGGFYWAGAYATDNYVVFGSDDGTGESDAESAVLYSVNPANGAIISKIKGLKGDIRSSIAYANGYVYFTTKGGMLYRVAIDANGTLGEVKSFDMGYMSTGTPVIQDGIVFVSRSGPGSSQFDCIGAVYAIDASTMEKISEVAIDGYIQSSMLLTTAYKDSDNALYLYATYNKEPGGMLVIKYDLTTKALSKEALYTPTGDKVEYNICSPICDADGNIYFKNDSGYIFAIGTRSADEKQIAAVQYKLNGGTAMGISDGSTKIYYSSDEGQTLPIPSKSGYTFKGWFSENNTSSTQYTQVSDKLPGTLYALWEEVKKPSGEGDSIKVTFRLIGAEQAKQMVDLSKDSYLPSYVTWISTKTYTVKAGTTVGEVFKKALGEAGIDYHGYEKNYINEIKAPASLGGYWLGEFDNGRKSGWMYTVNGTHPNKGLVEWTLNNGDVIVWHYVNDYSFEVEDWFDDPDYPKLATDDKYYNGWLKAADRVGASGGGVAAGEVEETKDVTTDTKTGTTTAPTEVKITEKTNADGTKTKVAEVKVSADNQKEILKQAKANKSKEIILSVATKAVQDATKAEVTLDKSFIDSIVKDTDSKLTVKTPFGDKTYTRDELKALSAAATGSIVTITVEKAAEEPADDAAKAEKIAKAKAIAGDMKLVARSSKTAKKNVKVTLKTDKTTSAAIKELKDLGFTVKYRFYRSTKKSAGYKSTVTKKTATYTNTSGKKGTKYFYKIQVRVYDEKGKLVAKTALKQCKYASRIWSKK